MRKQTINDVARLANVSKKTVSRVINQSPLLKQETRDKVLAVMADIGFVPDPQARALAFRRSFLIGFVYENPNAQYLIDMQQGILDAIRSSGHELVVHPYDRLSPSCVTEVRSFVERQKLFGVILPPSTSEDDSLCSTLKEIDCPYIRIASVAFDSPERSLVTNDRRGSVEAGLHLADLGHKKVGFISGPKRFRSSHERQDGLAEGLARRGVTLDKQYVAEGAYTFESGIACGTALLRRNPRPTAIFAGNDEMAAGVYRAARNLGLDIPRDLSVIGFDDSPIAIKLWPPLTSVRLPVRDMGRIAALKLLGGPENSMLARSAEVIPGLVMRQSTEPVARLK